MPTAIDYPIDDDDDDVDDEKTEVVDPASPGTKKAAKSKKSAPSATVSKARTKAKAIPSVTPKSATAKKRPASSSNTNNTKKSKKLVTGQMTLGSFFGAKKTTPPPPRSRPPSALPQDRYVDLKDIVLGKSTLTTTPKGPRRVSPTASQRKAWAAAEGKSRNANEDDYDDDDDDDNQGVFDGVNHKISASAASSPLATTTTTPSKGSSADNEGFNVVASTSSTMKALQGAMNESTKVGETNHQDQVESRPAEMVTHENETSTVNETQVEGSESAVSKENTKDDTNKESGQSDTIMESVASPDVKNEAPQQKPQIGPLLDDTDEIETQSMVDRETAVKQDVPTKNTSNPVDNTTQAVEEIEKDSAKGTTAPTHTNTLTNVVKCPDDKTGVNSSQYKETTSTHEADTANPVKESTLKDSSKVENSKDAQITSVGAKTSERGDTLAAKVASNDVEHSSGAEVSNSGGKEDESKKKLQSLYDTYSAQAVTLFAACREQLKDSIPPLDYTLPDEGPAGVEEAKTFLATLIEGRSESLANLAAAVAPQVSEHFPSVDLVSDHIKLLAKRQPLIKDHVALVLDETKAKSKVGPNIFEDESQDRFWQWQVTVVDLLPNKNVIKQRRAKIRKQVQHLHNLVAVLQTLKQLLQSKSEQNDALSAKLSRQEEKVLQYQREQEKIILEQQLKETQRKEKEKAKLAKREADAVKKQEAAEAAAAAAAKKKAAAIEASNAKKEAKAKMAEEKAKMAEEKAKLEEQEKLKKEAQLRRSQNTMLSFLKQSTPAPLKKEEAHDPVSTIPEPVIVNEVKSTNGFDVDNFRSQINSCKHDAVVSFGSPTESARLSRRRRSRSVQLSVYVTVVPDNPWEARPYADLQQVTVRNRYKFLSFNEDVRPPYHGTWSKKSISINPRNPFKKDREFFDYDYDSEGEWEEGDNDAGEDIENAADDEEEKDEEEGDADDDGWLAADDDLDDDPDEETRLLRQKMASQDEKASAEQRQSFIAPVNGQPIGQLTSDAKNRVSGFSVEDALQLLSLHTEIIVDGSDLYLDPFPPSLVEEDSAPSTPSDSNETSHADMQAFLRFVHHNSSASKDKLIEDLRAKLPDITSSRAHAFRTLETVAEKKKHPINGSIWEVKREVLEQYDMDDLLQEGGNDPESAKKEVLRTLAGHIHNSTHTSKEKLVDDLQANHSSILVSRAETIRHVDSLAEKKKLPGGRVLWEVKSTAQRNLGIELMPLVASVDNPVCDESQPIAKKRKLSVDEGEETTADVKG